jgi:hypothetical protein
MMYRAPACRQAGAQGIRKTSGAKFSKPSAMHSSTVKVDTNVR